MTQVPVPENLKDLQYWFGAILHHPLTEASEIQAIAPSGKSIEIEAARFIKPSSKLLPHQRLEIYCQQYWWRLLNLLQDFFPGLVRLFGYYSFNQQIAIPYLQSYPPNHWSLIYLGIFLPEWIKAHYDQPDCELVYNMACLDWAYYAAFYCPQEPGIEQLSDTSLKLFLQSHIQLFTFPYALPDFRIQLLKESVEHWEENEFPELRKDPRPQHFVVYRNRNSHISWSSLSATACAILALFNKGASIEEVSAWLEQQDAEKQQEAYEHLMAWFQEWTSKQWLTQTASL